MSVAAETKVVTVRLKPGQELPPHRSPSRVVITVVNGDGIIAVAGDGPRQLKVGVVVQIDEQVAHALTAGTDGLELLVARAENCCQAC